MYHITAFCVFLYVCVCLQRGWKWEAWKTRPMVQPNKPAKLWVTAEQLMSYYFVLNSYNLVHKTDPWHWVKSFNSLLLLMNNFRSISNKSAQYFSCSADGIFSSPSMSTLVSLVRNRFYTSMKNKRQSVYELASECYLTSVGFINRCSLDPRTLHESKTVRLVLSTALVSTELSTSLITFYPIPFTAFWNLLLEFLFQSESFVMQCTNNDAQYANTHRTLVT